MIASSHVELRDFLKQLIYPLMKQKLIQQAIKHGATSEAISDLESLPDKEYTSLEDVMKEFENIN